MIKRVIRSALIFLGIISIVPLCYLIYGYLTQNPWMILPVGDGQATASTWLDSNANGIRDPDEKNLPNVCIWYSYSLSAGVTESNQCEYTFTDNQGGWGEFLPGGSCDEVFIFVQSPSGFHPTTDVVSDGCDAEFGFVQANVMVDHKVLNIDEYVQQQNIFTRVKRITIGFIIIAISVLGTIWLEKPQKEGK